MALLGWENAIETSSTSLVASAAADGASAELLRVPIGAASVAWQTPAGTTAAALTVTAATAAVAWRAVSLNRTNLTTAATIRVRVSSAASLTTAPAYDSGVVSAGVAVGIGQALHVMPTAVSALAMRIDISDPANPDGAQFAAQGLLGNRKLELLPKPLAQIAKPPPHHAVDGGGRAAFDDRHQRLAVFCRKQSWLPWRLSVDQAARAFGVETQHPVTHYL